VSHVLKMAKIRLVLTLKFSAMGLKYLEKAALRY